MTPVGAGGPDDGTLSHKVLHERPVFMSPVAVLQTFVGSDKHRVSVDAATILPFILRQVPILHPIPGDCPSGSS